ncbi:sensor histidine kinase [Pseudoalteromonas 'SMAR']|uniref:sensor histidine kinase n=1 Tax=Pseudoalteromonas 'SMAR' TaxID=3416908 RepID=UPI003AF2BA3E
MAAHQAINPKHPNQSFSFKYFYHLSAISMLLFCLSVVFTTLAIVSKERQAQTIAKNFNLVRLSQELRLSSDQLTMMARAYAATGETRFKVFFDEILTIRNGSSPRPAHLNRVYWDMLMVEGGKAPFPKTAAKSLRTLLKENGIAQQELEILKQAENKSDALVSVEKNAFELIEKGQHRAALKLLYSQEYLRSKADIMSHINDFLAIREEGFSEHLRSSNNVVQGYYIAATVCFVLLLLSLLGLYSARSAIRRSIITYLNAEVTKQTQELVSKNDALNNAINELSDTQQRLIKAEKSATLIRLIPGLAHEINTPVGIAITASSNQLAVTKEVKQSISNNEVAKSALLQSIDNIENCAKLVVNSSERITAIINQLKIITNTDFSGTISSVNLAELLNECISSVSKHNDDVDVLVDISKALHISAPHGLLQQVFIPILENSYNHAFDDITNPSIVVSAKQLNNSIIIDICDNGCGISNEIKDKIFDPFVVGNRKRKGLGLGLSVALAIITQYFQGTIECYSEPSTGTRLVISIPIAA